MVILNRCGISNPFCGVLSDFEDAKDAINIPLPEWGLDGSTMSSKNSMYRLATVAETWEPIAHLPSADVSGLICRWLLPYTNSLNFNIC